MTPTRLVECLQIIRWSETTLAAALGCDEAIVDAWVLGFEDIPPKVAAWVEALCTLHTAAEVEKPKSMKGKVYKSLPR